MSKITKIINSVLLIALLLFTLGFIMLQSPLSPIATCRPNFDSCVFLYIGEHMGDGLVPYLDMFDQKGPLQFFINFIGIQMAGKQGVWFMQIISMATAMYFCYKIGKKYSNSLASVCATSIIFIFLQLFYETGNFTEEFALPFIFSALYLFLKYFDNDKYYLSKIQLFFIGFTFGMVLLLRPNMIALWIVFCVYIFIRSIVTKEYKFLLRCILWFLFGALVAVIPFLVYLGISGALPSFIEQYLLFNIQYSSTTWGKRIRTAIVFFKSSLFLVSTAFYIVVSLFEKNQKKRLIYRLLFIFSMINLILLSMSGRTYLHYGMIMLPGFIVPISIMIKVAFDYASASNGLKQSLIVPIAVIVTIVLSAGSLYDGLGTLKYTRNNSISGQIEVGKIIKENTKQDDKITVLQSDCGIYLQAGRMSSSKYMYQYPIADVSEKVRNEYNEHIINESPEIIVSTKNINMESLFPEKQYNFIKDNYSIIGKASEYIIYKLTK